MLADRLAERGDYIKTAVAALAPLTEERLPNDHACRHGDSLAVLIRGGLFRSREGGRGNPAPDLRGVDAGIPTRLRVLLAAGPERFQLGNGASAQQKRPRDCALVQAVRPPAHAPGTSPLIACRLRTCGAATARAASLGEEKGVSRSWPASVRASEVIIPRGNSLSEKNSAGKSLPLPTERAARSMMRPLSSPNGDGGPVESRPGTFRGWADPLPGWPKAFVAGPASTTATRFRTSDWATRAGFVATPFWATSPPSVPRGFAFRFRGSALAGSASSSADRSAPTKGPPGQSRPGAAGRGSSRGCGRRGRVRVGRPWPPRRPSRREPRRVPVLPRPAEPSASPEQRWAGRPGGPSTTRKCMMHLCAGFQGILFSRASITSSQTNISKFGARHR